MAAELIIAPEAEQDIAEAYAWYERQRAGLGEEYMSCVDACIQAITRTPLMHALSITRPIDVAWCAAFPTRCSTNTQRTK